MHIILETPRLILRRFTEADTRLLLQLNSNPEVLKYLHEPLLTTEEQALHVLQNIILPQYKNNLGRWAIHLKNTNEFIGWCGLKYRAELDEIDLGYRLMQEFWGKGYAFEAAKHTVDYGFNQLYLKKIVGRAHIDNAASLKILEKTGMQYIKDEVVDNCPVKTFMLSK
ncbi:GNAT family N-acetyltransferase [Ferruginibacter sp.]|nr:GNAT family N-acetyltransferase [Ferruginibacter sp.]